METPHTVNDPAPDSLPTRNSLLNRIKDLGDDASWRDFFETYWELIYNLARKAGLTDAEAQDVVQETVIAVSRKIAGFRTGAEHGSFKAWLLQQTRWRIVDEFRKRDKFAPAPRPVTGGQPILRDEDRDRHNKPHPRSGNARHRCSLGCRMGRTPVQGGPGPPESQGECQTVPNVRPPCPPGSIRQGDGPGSRRQRDGSPHGDQPAEKALAKRGRPVERS